MFEEFVANWRYSDRKTGHGMPSRERRILVQRKGRSYAAAWSE
jgi:hypothetical protein